MPSRNASGHSFNILVLAKSLAGYSMVRLTLPHPSMALGMLTPRIRLTMRLPNQGDQDLWGQFVASAEICKPCGLDAWWAAHE